MGDGGVAGRQPLVVGDGDGDEVVSTDRVDVAGRGKGRARAGDLGRAVAEVPAEGERGPEGGAADRGAGALVGVAGLGAVKEGRVAVGVGVGLGAGIGERAGIDGQVDEGVVLGAVVVDDGEVGRGRTARRDGVGDGEAGEHGAVADGPVGAGDGAVRVVGGGAVEDEALTLRHDAGDELLHRVGAGFLVERRIVLPGADVDSSADGAEAAVDVFGRHRGGEGASRVDGG